MPNVFDWFRRGGNGWQDTCAAGAPVPTPDFCAALDCDSVELTALAPGERGSVSCLQNPAGAAACKLASLGVLPGVELRLVQRYPAHVFRIGHAEFAIDAELARHVRVHRMR
jgi:DtxR family transcriptional regulator, Mn-dependent transcriptional regulator